MNADFGEKPPWTFSEEPRCPTIQSYWHSLPSSGDCPRDTQRIECGGDVLFLAVVLKHFKPPVRWLKRFAMQGTRQQRYLLEREDGVLLSPVTLEETRPDDQWMPKQTMFARPLRRRMREHFYVYRRSLLGNLRETVIVNGRTLTTEGERQAGYSEFMESLRWPVAIANDPILDHLPERQFYNSTRPRLHHPLMPSVCSTDRFGPCCSKSFPRSGLGKSCAAGIMLTPYAPVALARLPAGWCA